MRRGITRKLACGCAVGVTALLAGAVPAFANTIDVTTASGGCSLAAAITDVDTAGATTGSCAMASAGSNTIVLPPSTVDVGGTDLPITAEASGLTIEGASEATSVINAGWESRAFDVASGATVKLEDLTITAGLAKAGGAVGYSGGAIFNAGQLTVNDVAITASYASSQVAPAATAYGIAAGPAGTGGEGGAIYNGGGLSITDSSFQGDQAGPNGSAGAIAAVGGITNIAASTFYANEAESGYGGAVWSPSGSLSADNSTFDKNVAGVAGGALAVGSAATSSVVSDTIADNTAYLGGGIFAEAPDTSAYATAGTAVQNSLLASNTNGNCFASGLTDAGYNISYNAAGCPSTFLSGNPNLQVLANNGGPTLTMRLGSGSYAINRSPLYGFGCPTTDQRGVPRAGGKACDIGAYQVTAPVVKPDAASLITPVSAKAGALVTLDAGSGTAVIHYGATHKFGKAITLKLGASVAATTQSATLKGLKPAHWYYYDVTVTSSDGTTTTRAITFRTKGAPTDRKLRVTGLTAHYVDTDAGTTKLKLERCTATSGGRCTRYATVSTKKHVDKAGKTATVRLASKLAKGRYELRATPSWEGATGKVAVTTFAVS